MDLADYQKHRKETKYRTWAEANREDIIRLYELLYPFENKLANFFPEYHLPSIDKFARSLYLKANTEISPLQLEK